jgi:hypothetical protein
MAAPAHRSPGRVNPLSLHGEWERVFRWESIHRPSRMPPAERRVLLASCFSSVAVANSKFLERRLFPQAKSAGLSSRKNLMQVGRPMADAISAGMDAAGFPRRLDEGLYELSRYQAARS